MQIAIPHFCIFSLINALSDSLDFFTLGLLLCNTGGEFRIMQRDCCLGRMLFRGETVEYNVLLPTMGPDCFVELYNS